MAKKLKNVEIIDSIFPNMGIGYYGDDNREIRVKNALVGQKVEAIPGRKRKTYRQGKIYNVLERSPMETNEGCVHKEECGGCVYQSLTYEKELDYKKYQIEKLLENTGLKVKEVIESPSYKAYRNKMEYTFGDEYKGGPLALGMHKKNKFYEIINTDHCLIVHEDFNKIIKNVREYFENLGLKHYHKTKNTGNLRHLVIRRSEKGDILLNLVVTFSTEFDKEEFLNMLNSINLEGDIKSVYITYNDSKSDAVIPEKVVHLYGDEFIEEEILGLKFKITPFSFFQTNTKSAEVLYKKAISLLDNIDEKIIFDLYSGTGTITQILGKKAKKVIGIEIVEEAVESAKESAKSNNIENVKFIEGDVLEQVDKLSIKPDIIVLDPPRVGIHPKAIEKIIDFSPEEFLYISCNPKTFVRDVEIFREKGYETDSVIFVDQFPRTSHGEVITLLRR